MSKIAFTPDNSGTGTFTIASPNSNTDRTLTLPDASGTVNTSGSANEVPAGSAGAPAIYPTGDTNTGIFFPAADTIAFSEGGVERLRIADAGQFGIGGANYGTSGQALTSNGPSNPPSWRDPGATVLLGILFPTSGSTATLSGLTLTPYSLVIITHTLLSTNTTGSVFQLNGREIGRGGDANQDGFSGGGLTIDMATGQFWGGYRYWRSSTVEGVPSAVAGPSGLTSFSTSISITTNSGAFDGGQIYFRGVR